MEENRKKATFANGCFWCTEAVFQRFKGVYNVKSGFTGGFIKNPPYREVAMSRTNHAEAIQLDYDPDIISYKELLEVFFTTHDPTTLNKQGYDVGTQYRSAIFYSDQSQKKEAEDYIDQLEREKVFNDPIVTEVTELGPFYPAEVEHDEYYNKHRAQGYCRIIIDPKVEKIKKSYQSKLKEEFA